MVSGYCGFGNAGDEAVLAGIAESFRATGGRHEIIPISANPKDTLSQHGLHAIPRNDVRGMLEAIRQADIFLSGGGSLFQDATSARSAAYYLLQFWFASAIAQKPSVVFAQGIGPLRRRWVRGLTRRALDRAALILLRDEQSKGLLKQIGVKRPPIEVTADPSFALPLVGRSEGKRLVEEFGLHGSEPVIAVCPRPWGSAEWAGVFADALAAAVREIGGRALFLALHPKRDTTLAREMAAGIPGSVVAEQAVTFRDIRGAIAGSDMVIATRLHGTMFAVREGIPAVGISYDPKVEAFCESCGLPYVKLEELTAGNALARIRSAWRERESLAASLALRSEELARAATRNAELVSGLI